MISRVAICRTVLAVSCGLMGTVAARAETFYETACARLATNREPDAVRLNALFKLDWAHGMRENPEFATQVGYPGYNDRWTDQSLEAITRRKRELQAPLRVLESIRRAKLDGADRLNYDLYRYNLDNAVAGSRFPGEYLAISQLGGVQQDAAQTLELAPRSTVQDYENIIARLRALPKLIDQNIVLLGKGLETGVTQPRVTLSAVPDQVKAQMVEDPERNPLLRPFWEFPATIPEAERARLRKAATAVLREEDIPAFGRMYEFLVSRRDSPDRPVGSETDSCKDGPGDRADGFQGQFRSIQ